MKAVDDPIAAAPDRTGPHGRAWLLDTTGIIERQGLARDQDATVASWIIEAPWAHGLWHSYNLVLVHLRPMADGRPTLFYVDGATHEFWLYALDPVNPRGTVLTEGRARWLVPANFAAQFVADNDAAAFERMSGVVDLIVAGMLNPDTDALQQWVGIFGNGMLKR